MVRMMAHGERKGLFLIITCVYIKFDKKKTEEGHTIKSAKNS